jgi:hypothetical protein
MKSFPAMNSPRILWIALLLGFASVSGGLAQSDLITACVAPKTCELSKIEPGKPWAAVITYTVENKSQRVQVLSRYCTIRLEGVQNGRAIELRGEGRDGTRFINSGDIVVLKPGEVGQLTARIYMAVAKGEKPLLFRVTEDGSSWGTELLTVPGVVELRGTYDPAFARKQSGFASVGKDMAALAEKAAGWDYELVANLKLAPVSITLEK